MKTKIINQNKIIKYCDGFIGTYNHLKRLNSFNGCPAITRSNGYKAYYLNGFLHNEKGAAVIWENGIEGHYLNGKIYSVDQWKIEVKKINSLRKLKHKLKDSVKRIRKNKWKNFDFSKEGITELVIVNK
jgi:hypothetical protein